MNIVNLFIEAAKEYPHNKAIIEKNKFISYQSLAEEVQKTALYFTDQGIKKGDRVLVFVPMGIDLYRIVLALFYIGATAVFLDEWVGKKRLEQCCRLADCKGFIGVLKARIFSWFSKELRQIPIKLSLKNMKSGNLIPMELEQETPALITFTTGSTGTPKAALRSHGFLKEQFDALLNEIEPNENDIDMPVLPIVLFVNLGVGCTSVIADFKMTKVESLDASKIISQISSEKVNRITASPFFVKKLAKETSKENLDFPSLKKIFTGGAPVFPNEAKMYENAFPNAKSTIVYGSTEAEPISSILTDQLIEKETQLELGLPVGETYSRVELKIIGITENGIVLNDSSELSDLELSNGSVGEIIVAGHHVLKTYFNNEEAFRENKIVVGDTIWHRTGDSGYLKDNELYLTGRCKQLIWRKGQFISPFIMENKLANLEGVSSGTVMDFKNKIILVVESVMTQANLKEILNEFNYDELKILKKIPKDPRHNSKIDYEKLKTFL